MGGATAEDRRLLADLAEQYGPAVRAYFARRISVSADVEDLCQEVFIRLLKRAELGAIDNAEGYIFQVAANVLRDRFRTAGRRLAVVGDISDNEPSLENEELSPERVLLGKEAVARMMRALLALPERTRMIVMLNRYEMLSAREIAARLGVSVSLVEKEMMRATALLRDSVK